MEHPNLQRRRKPVVTPARVKMICELMAKGETERSACIRASIGSTAWNAAKRSDGNLRERIATARDDCARLRHAQHVAALYTSQAARSAMRKALKPQPIYQAKLVMWHLINRVPLTLAGISEEEIGAACQRFSLSLDIGNRQQSAFGLLTKVYQKLAAIRGQHPIITTPAWASEEANDAEDDEYTY
ncbi:MAG: hypothetical protein ACR2MF_03700 [Chthoniobacterales bacterium]